MLRQALRQAAAKAKQNCLRGYILAQGNLSTSEVESSAITLWPRCEQVLSPSTLQAPALLEVATVPEYRALCRQTWLRSSFSTKAQEQETEAATAQEASGSNAEQAANTEQEAMDPKDQLLAERDQQVLFVCIESEHHMHQTQNWFGDASSTV